MKKLVVWSLLWVVLSGWVDLSGLASLAGGVASLLGGVASLPGGVAAGRERSMPEGLRPIGWALVPLIIFPSQLHMHSSDMALSRLRAAAGLSFSPGEVFAESVLCAVLWLLSFVLVSRFCARAEGAASAKARIESATSFMGCLRRWFASCK